MKRFDRLREMARRTMDGEAKEGFFIPYRYAESVKPPRPYPDYEALFEFSSPAFRAVLAEIEACADALLALNGPPPRPRWDQDWFPRTDGAAAYSLVASCNPRRIIEVGSGHSTRFMAEAIRAEDIDCDLTCIDPAPRAGIGDLDVSWIEAVLSEDHFPLFEALEPGDIAFFDSSHILVPGSDVDMIINRIIPRIKPGVMIHIHDILLPDPYPDVWEWRGYAEQNALGPWLLAGGLKPIFSSHYAVSRMGATSDGVLSKLPLKDGAMETSLWTLRT